MYADSRVCTLSILQKAGVKKKTSPERAGREAGSIECQINFGFVLLEVRLDPETPAVAGLVARNHICMLVDGLEVQKTDLWARFPPISRLMRLECLTKVMIGQILHCLQAKEDFAQGDDWVPDSRWIECDHDFQRG